MAFEPHRKNTVQFKALCYPGLPKNVPLNRLIRLAEADGKKVLEGRTPDILDRLWSEVCGFWVVVVAPKRSWVEKDGSGSRRKEKA